MGGTPQCIEDTRRGVFSYEALKSRLENSRFSDGTTRDLLAPIIRLKTLTPEEKEFRLICVNDVLKVEGMFYVNSEFSKMINSKMENFKLSELKHRVARHREIYYWKFMYFLNQTSRS